MLLVEKEEVCLPRVAEARKHFERPPEQLVQTRSVLGDQAVYQSTAHRAREPFQPFERDGLAGFTGFERDDRRAAQTDTLRELVSAHAKRFANGANPPRSRPCDRDCGAKGRQQFVELGYL